MDKTNQNGFTLIEVMVTMMVIALVLQLATANLGAAVPGAKLDAESSKLVSRLDWLRSEARIQGKHYEMHLDLEGQRWRIVLPPEQRVSIFQTAEELDADAWDWSALDRDVKFRGAGNATQGIVRNGIYEIEFDENGFTGDQSIFLGLENDEDMIWSVHIHGLTGQAEVIQDYEGREHLPDTVGEGAF